VIDVVVEVVVVVVAGKEVCSFDTAAVAAAAGQDHPDVQYSGGKLLEGQVEL